MADDKAPGKGFFGRARLPVALAYILPAGRSGALLAGAAVALIGTIALVGDFVFRGGHFVSSGALSASHATLENRCDSCHTSFEAVSAEKCETCHERTLAPAGTHTFNAHYVYVSGDQSRVGTRDGEVACAACHTEHRGREVRPTLVAADRCINCHEYAPFETAHPDFAFTAQPASDGSALKFTHIKHVERVLDETPGEVEGACLTCHKPASDGRGFEPIRFATSCTGCHLGPDSPSADLPVVAATAMVRRVADRAELRLGVETLDMIRSRRGPGEQWALATNPTYFDQHDGQVTKTRVDHMDPWITHNLRNLRRALYPTQGLADLLVASPDVDARDRRVLYEEALRTVKGYAAGLEGRSQASLQGDLAEITEEIAAIERRLADPSTTLSTTPFRLDQTRDPLLTDAQVTEINAFAEQVAEPCATCHLIEGATIVRPAGDQRVLRRAVFNHRAHVIQRGCLQCHTEIPFADYLDTEQRVPPAVDRAAIQNIPRIAVCRECHAPEKAATACRTCHLFHPTSGTWPGLTAGFR